ncbi:MAG: hypothetical protein QOI70_1584 [Microbacteriaceae bacterium]|nr:hypothetical protein [Microbacteriaceae bacterium]
MSITAECTGQRPSTALAQPVKSPAINDLKELELLSAKIADDEGQLTVDKAARNKMAIAARTDGFPRARIEEATGMSRQSLHEATMRANGGVLPVPRQHG